MLKTAKTTGRRSRHLFLRHSPNRSTISPRFSPRLGTRNPRQRLTVRSRDGAAGRIRGCVMRECGKPLTHAGKSRRNRLRGLVSRSATALTDPRRLRGMRPAHECSGDRHYPCGSRFAIEDRRRRENAESGLLRGNDRRRASRIGAIGKRNWMHVDPGPTIFRSASFKEAPLWRHGKPGDERPRRTISGGGTDPERPEGRCDARYT